MTFGILAIIAGVAVFAVGLLLPTRRVAYPMMLAGITLAFAVGIPLIVSAA
jgi:hypothetical protein